MDAKQHSEPEVFYLTVADIGQELRVVAKQDYDRLEEQLEAARRWHTEVCGCGDFDDHLASYPAKEPSE